MQITMGALSTRREIEGDERRERERKYAKLESLSIYVNVCARPAWALPAIVAQLGIYIWATHTLPLSVSHCLSLCCRDNNNNSIDWQQNMFVFNKSK